MIEKLAYDARVNKFLSVHDWSHTLRVVEMAVGFALQHCKDKVEEVRVAAYFHDVGREDDGDDKAHGVRSAEIFFSLKDRFS